MKREQAQKQHGQRAHRVPDEQQQKYTEYDPLQIADVQISEFGQALSQDQALVPRGPQQTVRSRWHHKHARAPDHHQLGRNHKQSRASIGQQRQRQVVHRRGFGLVADTAHERMCMHDDQQRAEKHDGTPDEFGTMRFHARLFFYNRLQSMLGG